MSTLLLVGLGPVQEFIERARRTRDLWFGSHILSEMSRAVAGSLRRSGWKLVFPSFDDNPEELELCKGMWREREPGVAFAPVAVSNKILAVREGTHADAEVEADASKARAAAVDAWKVFASAAVEAAGDLLRKDIPAHHGPREAIEDLLELVVAWRAYEGDGYGEARKDAEEAVTARKLLRGFQAWRGAALPKSSLDGHRETILVKDKERRRAARRFRLGEDEQLDGIGVVKRMGGEPEQFVPVARVALAPWIRAVETCVRRAESPRDRELARLWHKLEDACREYHVPRCDPYAAQWLMESFRFDGEIFLEGRWGSMDFDAADQEKAFGTTYVKPLLEALGGGAAAPYPYVACLRGDGDRMGAALSRLGSVDEHQGFSKRLADFAKGVRTTVEKHLGVAVFSGGDDVLALLPAENAVACAVELQHDFSRLLAPLLGYAPTLSIGVAVCHVLTPLGELLGKAKEAERLAKEGDELPEKDSRCALGIVVDKRSGGAVSWRCRWADDPAGRLQKLVDGFSEGRLPGGLPHELGHLLRKLPDPEGEEENLEHDRFWADLLRKDVHAVLRRKRPEQNEDSVGVEPSDVDLVLAPDADYGVAFEQLSAWVDRALLARTLADARRRSVLAGGGR